MPGSRRWNTLRRDCDTLRRQFLPTPFDPLGIYRNVNQVQAYTRAFLVLSHAEIESFLEAWAKEIAKLTEQAWTSSQRVTQPLLFLVAALSDGIPVPATIKTKVPKDSHQLLADALATLFTDYFTTIKDNHGIKEANVLKLFSPLGVPHSAFGSTLLPNLNTLGERRGAHAHNSAKAVASPLDPETQYKHVQTVVSDLLVLDAWLVAYKRKIQ